MTELNQEPITDPAIIEELFRQDQEAEYLRERTEQEVEEILAIILP